MTETEQQSYIISMDLEREILYAVILVIIGSLIYFTTQLKKSTGKNFIPDVKHVEHIQPANLQKPSNKKKKGVGNASKESRKPFAHQFLKKTLKGHGNKVLDMDVSSNGKLLASCSEDRCIMIWSLKDITSKDQRNIRGNVDFDYASRIRWSPDNKAFLIQRTCDSTIDVFKLTKKADGFFNKPEVTTTFPKEHSGNVVGVDIASNGKYIMSCSDKNDMIIWSLKGVVLARINTHQGNTCCARASPCARFVASSGFTSDVKVWEVVFNKAGEFDKVDRAFELKGHHSGVPTFAFSADSSRMLSVSKDKTWRLYDIQVEFKHQQDPILLNQGVVDCSPEDSLICALSSDGRTIAIAVNRKLSIISAVDAAILDVIDEPHSDTELEDITAILFDPFNKYIFTSGDKVIRVFKNIPGYQAIIKDLENKLPHANVQMKKRIAQQIEEAKDCLNSLMQ